jgi:hypothetical protein
MNLHLLKLQYVLVKFTCQFLVLDVFCLKRQEKTAKCKKLAWKALKVFWEDFQIKLFVRNVKGPEHFNIK